MITDEELSQLPDDPELAFVEFEKVVRRRYYEAEQQVAEMQYGNSDSYRLEYINKVLAAARVYGISELAKWNVPAVNDRIFDAFAQFTSDVDHFTTQIRIRHVPRNRQVSVGLDSTTKAKIHHLIQQIRSIIEGADLPTNKQDALYGKLNRFAAEVDRTRTGLGASMAVFIEICDGIGQGFEKLEPAKKLIDSIAALLGRAKDVEDSLRPQLPVPEERRQLEAPRKQLAPPSSPPDLDDEIPF